jgi:dimethylglycine dehydrogenase
MRVSYSGELAFELHISNEHLRAVYQLLRDAGEDFDLVQFGQYAAESMRIEKGYLHWKADIISEIDPFEAGLQRFVRMDKPDFIGKRALATRAQSPRRCLVTLALDNHDGPAHSGESIMHEGRVIGSVTSAAWGYRVAKNLALALVQPRYANIGERVSVLTLGDVHDATVLERCQYDPDNARVRS